MRTFFVRNNNLNWRSCLQDIADSINTNRNRIMKATPTEIMEAYYRNGDMSTWATKTLDSQMKKYTQNFNANNLVPRDRVRVKLSSLFSELRAREKSGESKKTVIRWSPTVYIVNKILKPKRNEAGYPAFFLVDSDTRKIVRTEIGGPPRPFFANDLLKVPADQTTPISNKRAAQLNMVDWKEAHPQPAQEQPVADKPIPPPKPPKPPTEWQTKEWAAFLVGKEFSTDTSKGPMRCEIYAVKYDRKYKTYVVSYKMGGRKEYMSLPEVLTDSRSEPWYNADLEAVIE
jgi:hypothetical protein